MTKHLDTTLLLDKLEEAFIDHKEYLLEHNKRCTDGKTFLSKTYSISRNGMTDDGTPKYLAVVFKDLSEDFASRLSKQIKSEINSQGFECETISRSYAEDFFKDNLS